MYNKDLRMLRSHHNLDLNWVHRLGLKSEHLVRLTDTNIQHHTQQHYQSCVRHLYHLFTWSNAEFFYYSHKDTTFMTHR